MVIIIIVQIGEMLIGCIKKLNKSKIGCLILAKEFIPLWSENAKYIEQIMNICLKYTNKKRNNIKLNIKKCGEYGGI